DTLVIVGIATDVAIESTARAASDLGYRTIVVSDACTADSDESHARSLDVLQKWFAETTTADQVLSALGDSQRQSGPRVTENPKESLRIQMPRQGAFPVCPDRIRRYHLCKHRSLHRRARWIRLSRDLDA